MICYFTSDGCLKQVCLYTWTLLRYRQTYYSDNTGRIWYQRGRVEHEKEPIEIAEYTTKDGREVLIKQIMRYESKTQINRIEWHYFINGEFDSVQNFDMRLFFPQELDSYLEWNGFKILHKFGSFEEEAFCDHSEKQIFVCQWAIADWWRYSHLWCFLGRDYWWQTGKPGLGICPLRWVLEWKWIFTSKPDIPLSGEQSFCILIYPDTWRHSQTFHHLGKVLFGGRNNKYIEKGRIS